jgi:hypothetical protein
VGHHCERGRRASLRGRQLAEGVDEGVSVRARHGEIAHDTRDQGQTDIAMQAQLTDEAPVHPSRVGVRILEIFWTAVLEDAPG